MERKSTPELALERALAQEIQDVIRVKSLSVELLSAVEDASFFLLEESKRAGIRLVNERQLQGLLRRIEALMGEASPVAGHPKKSPANGTEPDERRHF